MSAAVATPESVTVTPPPAGSVVVVPPPRTDVVVLPDTDWATYLRVGEAFADRPAVKIIYDRGRMQIMAPSYEHEFDGQALGELITELTRELDLPYLAGGSVTMRREDLDRGIEGDKVYWLANADRMAGVRVLDLRIHPPPDLAFEVEVSRSILDKPAIYAALGVPELWRLNGDELRFGRLGTDGRYADVPSSPSLAGVTPEELMPYVVRCRGSGSTTRVMREFRAWVRERFTPPQTPTPAPSAD